MKNWETREWRVGGENWESGESWKRLTNNEEESPPADGNRCLDDAVRKGGGEAVGQGRKPDKHTVAESHLPPGVEEAQEQGDTRGEAGLKGTNEETSSHESAPVVASSLEDAGTTKADAERGNPDRNINNFPDENGLQVGIVSKVLTSNPQHNAYLLTQ